MERQNAIPTPLRTCDILWSKRCWHVSGGNLYSAIILLSSCRERCAQKSRTNTHLHEGHHLCVPTQKPWFICSIWHHSYYPRKGFILKQEGILNVTWLFPLEGRCMHFETAKGNYLTLVPPFSRISRFKPFCNAFASHHIFPRHRIPAQLYSMPQHSSVGCVEGGQARRGDIALHGASSS
jgi:hypothetical protein